MSVCKDCRVTTLGSELKVVFYALQNGMKPEVGIHDLGLYESKSCVCRKGCCCECTYSVRGTLSSRFTSIINWVRDLHAASTAAFRYFPIPTPSSLTFDCTVGVSLDRDSGGSGVRSFARSLVPWFLPSSKDAESLRSAQFHTILLSFFLSATPPKRDANMCLSAELLYLGRRFATMLLHLARSWKFKS